MITIIQGHVINIHSRVEPPKQRDYMVRDYINRHIADKHRKEFIRLIKQWDHSPGTLDSFYNVDLLHQINNEAIEAI